MPTLTVPRRLLASPVVDLLLGPHGVDRYLELIRPVATVPEQRPETLVLISGGSGITPVLSMLRTLVEEGHDGEILFVHYARTEADWLYRDEVARLAERHTGLHVHYVATREGGARVGEAVLRELLPAGALD